MATTPAQSTLPPLQQRFKGCSNISNYQVLGKLGEGTFGEVHKARSLKSNRIVALKKILMHNEKDGFPVTAIREIKLLKSLSHINILRLVEMAVERPKVKDRKQKAIMYMVTPYMEHDLSGLLTNPDVRFTEPQIKCYMLQLLEGLRYLHCSHILHRDMKAANLLISNRGILQIADFGLARHYDEPVPQKGRPGGEARRDYTALVVTRWYRPPELLLSLRRYTPAIDLWGVGCVFAEMFKRTPILQGQSDLAQLEMIFDLVGAPTDESMPGWNSLPGCDGVFRAFESSPPSLPQKCREWGVTPTAIPLLSDLLKLDWRKRITAIDALDHGYFKTPPLPAKPSEIPTFEDSHELDHRRSRGQKGTLPPAPAGGTVGMGPNAAAEWTGAGGAGPSAFSGPGSRPPSRNNDRSRAPSQHTQDARKPQASVASSSGNHSQRPGWARETHELPPRPPKPADVLNKQSNVRGSNSSGPNARPAKDSYVPSYSKDGTSRRSSDGNEREERDAKDSEKRSTSRDRERPRERDMMQRDREREFDRGRDRGGDRGGRGGRDRVEIDRYTPGQVNDWRDRDRDYDKPRDREREKGRQNGHDNINDRRDRPRDRDRSRERSRDSPGSAPVPVRNRKRTRSPSDDENSRERKVRERSRERDRERQKDRGHNAKEREGLHVYGRR